MARNNDKIEDIVRGVLFDMGVLLGNDVIARRIRIGLMKEFPVLTQDRKETDMKTLSITPQPAPEAAPHLDMTGIVHHTATVIPKRGDEFWVCNPMNELADAMESGEPFIAHQIGGMIAKQVIIMPGTIARIQEV